jgi:8-oxo-dGTP diphosphatase
VNTESTQRRAYSVAVYPRCGGRALLILHKRLGVWLPPGGECLPGETPIEAAARELFEETGLRGRFPQTSPFAGTPLGFLGYEEHIAGSKGLHMNFVFVVDVATTDIKPNDEFTDWRWVDRMDGLTGPENVGQFLHAALAAPAAPAVTA